VGNDEHVSIYTPLEDTVDCTWELHVMPRYNELVSRSQSALTVTKSLINRFSDIDEDLSRYSSPDYGSLRNSIDSLLHGSCLPRLDILELDPTGKYYEVAPHMTSAITAYTAVGTKVPSTITEKEWLTATLVCGNPAQFVCVIIGDSTQAYTVLGKSLSSIRSIVLDTYGIMPSDNSLPLSIKIPMVAVEFPEAPKYTELVGLLYSRDPEDLDSLWLGDALATAYGSLYSIARFDSRVFGLDTLGTKVTSKFAYTQASWGLADANGNTVHIPYRYPLLVALLANLGCGGARDHEPGPVYLSTMLRSPTVWKDAINLREQVLLGKSPYLGSAAHLASNVRSAMVELYAHTCKNCISFPPASEFPKRTEASKKYWYCFQAYKKKASLSAYLELGEAIVHASLVENKGAKHLSALFPDLDLRQLILDSSDLEQVSISVADSLDCPELISCAWSLDKVAEVLGGLTLTDAAGRTVAVDDLIHATRVKMLSLIEDIADNSPHTLVKERDLSSIITDINRKLLNLGTTTGCDFISNTIGSLAIVYPSPLIPEEEDGTALRELIKLMDVEGVPKEPIHKVIRLVAAIVAVPPIFGTEEWGSYNNYITRSHARQLASNYLLSLLD
jgi:hypothetical protein